MIYIFIIIFLTLYIYNKNNNNKYYYDVKYILYSIKNNKKDIIFNIINNNINNNDKIEIIFQCIYYNRDKLLRKILSNINIEIDNYFYNTISDHNYLDKNKKCIKILLKYIHNIDYNKLYNSISLSKYNNHILNYIFKLYNYNHDIYIHYYDYTNNTRLKHCLINNNISSSLILKNYINNIDDIEITIDKLKIIFRYIDKLYYKKLIEDIIKTENIELIDYIIMKLDKNRILDKNIKYIKKESIIKLNNIEDITNKIKLNKYHWNKFIFNCKILKIIINNNLLNLINIIDQYNKKIDDRIKYIKNLDILTDDIIEYNLRKYLIY